MKAIAIFTLVICCIGVESFPGVREKRETATGCSFLFRPVGAQLARWPQVFPKVKRYEVFWKGGREDEYSHTWQESREACQAFGGDLAEPLTREEQAKIMEGISKLPSGAPRASSQGYWIGLEKKTADAIWVSGKKMKLNSDLIIDPVSLGFDQKYRMNVCGMLGIKGIRDLDCDYGLAGYVCEFENAAPICIQ